MTSNQKTQKQILAKLGIKTLNEMQEAAQLAIQSAREVILLSPTGTGKTLAFLLPVIEALDPDCEEVQLLIVVPSRELAIQIENVARNMGTGYKIHAAYGGQSFNTDRQAIKHRPAILIGTPGRLADHMRRETFSTDHIKTLILDEFDKSLEVGFEGEMTEILSFLPALEKKVLTSATQGIEIPKFVGLTTPVEVDYLHEGGSKLEIKAILSPDKDKLDMLVKALCHLGDQPGIIFCNFKGTIARISEYLSDRGIAHGTFYGGMEQRERELSLLKFRNGTHQLLLATDLAARGIDVPEIKFILHYHLPIHAEEFTHRNGRTARMRSEGTAYVLHWKDEKLPEFMPQMDEEFIHDKGIPDGSQWHTLELSGGRKDKISKGDIAGFFFKEGNIDRAHLGTIEVKNTQSFVSVHKSIAEEMIKRLDNKRLKKAKLRIQHA
ncbi:DEAD/DEAH box helicase [Dokdonia sp. 4H-3-7-5]|uniref:DEAD/DEAH box helicase n=1 Tax=Dokdonia sp. (strain 4H-3-7-5) TaxID=983548 RepID=UPI00020A64D1|nr:DEAD/DEAH box helicase [Dokdonia sp. 4H-3-7-5]AEE20581.1 DEAD/DEAH box helicase domain protein [Dokdonia sp. 4H-3-7-5]